MISKWHSNAASPAPAVSHNASHRATDAWAPKPPASSTNTTHSAKVCFYYRDGEPSVSLQPDPPDLHVATVVLKKQAGTIEQTMRVKVFVHRGRFFSLEFPKRPERYAQQHGIDLKELIVAHVETHEVLTPVPRHFRRFHGSTSIDIHSNEVNESSDLKPISHRNRF